MADLDAEALAGRLSERSPSGIAEQIRELIDAGILTSGTRLPTVRDVATEVGVSVGTIAQAWAMLREGGLVETRRRGGTRVVGDDSPGPEAFPGWHALDLLFCSPDPTLLPPMEEAFTKALRQPAVNTWGRDHIVEALHTEVQRLLGEEPHAAMAVNSGAQGLWLATRAAASPGQTVAVEEPASPGYLAAVRSMGVEPVGIPVDSEGPLPEPLHAALEGTAVAFVHSPSGPFSDRHRLSAARREALGAVLEAHSSAVIIEDEPLTLASDADLSECSLQPHFPARTMRVLGFERAFGLDLRTSVLTGSKALVDRAVSHRFGGMSSNSRILQYALTQLLRDPTALRRIESARSRYAARRRMALGAFESAGLAARSGPSSWAVWVEVPDEQQAALALSGEGVTVDVGANSFVSAQPTGLLRLSAAHLPEDAGLLENLGTLIRRASSGELNATFV